MQTKSSGMYLLRAFMCFALATDYVRLNTLHISLLHFRFDQPVRLGGHKQKRHKTKHLLRIFISILTQFQSTSPLYPTHSFALSPLLPSPWLSDAICWPQAAGEGT